MPQSFCEKPAEAGKGLSMLPIRPNLHAIAAVSALSILIGVASGQAVPGVTGGTAAGSGNFADQFETIHNDFNWTDDTGQRILTRSGCLAQFNGVFYWYGGNPRGFREQHCYTSTDLVHWTHKGVVLKHDTDANRIDVLYNDSTKTYVMFLKYDGNGAHFGIATAEKPEGPFTLKSTTLIDGARIGDMSMFKDDDGTAYLCYVSWAKGTNAQHGIYRMSADYLTPEKRIYLWDIGHREAPHLFKRNGVYYYGTSETAWIDSTGTTYYSAKNLEGPWTTAAPMLTPGSDNSWDSQCDFVFPIQGRRGTVYMFAGDRWIKDPEHGRNGSYVWLPMEFEGDKPILNYHQDWEINLAEGTWRGFDGSRNLAVSKSVTASSEEGANVARNVTAPKTFKDYVKLSWTSEAIDPQWIAINLGEPTEFNRVILKWNMSAAAEFTIQTSSDATTWTDVFRTGQGSANVVTDVRFPNTTARYVRMNGTQRAPVQVDTRRKVPGDPGAATRPSSRPATQPAPPGRYSLFDFMILKD